MASKWLETAPQSLNKLIERIRSGDIKIPAFQREFVWDQTQILHLIDSINRGYPIGSILLWLTDERLAATRDIGGFNLPNTQEKYPVNYVLDGQQRLTSIYATLTLDQKEEESMFNLYYDIESNCFFPTKEECVKPFPIKVLFDTLAFLENIKSLEDGKDQERVAMLQTRFKEYDIPVVTITEQEHEQVCIIFERINNSGTGLTLYELMSAWTWSTEFDLREKYQDFVSELEEKNFGGIGRDIVLRIIGGVISNKTGSKAILELNPQTIRENIERVKQAACLAIDYLSTELKISSTDFLPFPMQLVPLSVLFDKVKVLTALQNQKIKKWFWKSSFSGRYSKATEQNVILDIEDMLVIAKDENAQVFEFRTSINPAIFSTRKFQKNAVYTKAFIVLLAQSEPKDLLNGQVIDIGKALSSYNYKEFHHIFPQAYLKAHGFDYSKINVLANYCFLSASVNKAISDKKPSEYFKLIPPELRESILCSALIQDDLTISTDNYEAFLESRSKLLISKLDRLLT